MGVGKSAPVPSTPPPLQQEQRLNTQDLEDALDLVFTLGKPPEGNETFKVFNYIIDARDAVLGIINSNQEFKKFMASDAGKRLSERVVLALDADGDGRVTPRDFQIMYDHDLKNLIRHNKGTLDDVLPLFGQCLFGFTMGLAVGRQTYRLYQHKAIILTSGLVLYSGLQYLAQMNFVNQKLLEATFQEKLRQVADVNGDGELNREDLELLVENRMRYVATKLGPGGIAPGMLGYATLGLGVLRGLRRI
ncbi:hypothetical protein DQ04_00621030 [Trypanosoma grayi]|uniref:hypothetical protein n=1 Tax=Trypanosoma grayi TaxID=71804 RepID=UPI0004F403F1|nr:hypothetical protein DQ04_00621030 [Trypanosoma grayi]KEG14094.1 hypothetical protein DQ04_00621030 [Trypanosoma grayi]